MAGLFWSFSSKQSKLFDRDAAIRIEKEILIRNKRIFQIKKEPPKQKPILKNNINNRYSINWQHNSIFDKLEPETETVNEKRNHKISLGKRPKETEHFENNYPLELKIQYVYEAHMEKINLKEKLIKEIKIPSGIAENWVKIIATQTLDFLEILNDNQNPKFIQENQKLVKIMKNQKNKNK